MIYLFSYKTSYYYDYFYNQEDEGTYCIVFNSHSVINAYWKSEYSMLDYRVEPFNYDIYERVMLDGLPTPEMFELRKEQIIFDKL